MSRYATETAADYAERPRTRTIEFGPGRSVEVTLAEAGTGRTALVLHGGGGPATVQGIAAHLSGAMGVLTPVHPGWDGTARPGWLSAIGDLAAAYLRLLRDEGHRDVLVVGSSIGGWIGAEMAARDDSGLISGLVLIDSVGVLVEGRTALVLHGGGGPATVQGITAHLSGAMGVLTPVHPGWDGTARPGWLSAIGDLAAAYLRLLRDEGRRDVLVVGSSIGGWIAAEMAARDDSGLISGLVLIDSVGVLVEGQPIRDFFALDARGVGRGRVLVLRRRPLLRRPGHRAAGAGGAARRQHGDHARLRRRPVHARPRAARPPWPRGDPGAGALG